MTQLIEPAGHLVTHPDKTERYWALTHSEAVQMRNLLTGRSDIGYDHGWRVDEVVKPVSRQRYSVCVILEPSVKGSFRSASIIHDDGLVPVITDEDTKAFAETDSDDAQVVIIERSAHSDHTDADLPPSLVQWIYVWSDDVADAERVLRKQERALRREWQPVVETLVTEIRRKDTPA